MNLLKYFDNKSLTFELERVEQGALEGFEDIVVLNFLCIFSNLLCGMYYKTFWILIYDRKLCRSLDRKLRSYDLNPSYGQLSLAKASYGYLGLAKTSYGYLGLAKTSYGYLGLAKTS